MFGIVVGVKVYVELMGVYSKCVRKLSDFKNGVIIVLLNDLSNSGCVLKFFEWVGLICLKFLVGISVMVWDIMINFKCLKFCEFEVV